ncbi:MAG: LTA synthase family protein, partial [Bacteroidota bacterium]
IWMVGKVFREKSDSTPGTWRARTVFILLWASLSITAVRGGWQQLPVNETFVFYSKDQFLNHTAVNPVWHLAYDIKMAGFNRSNPFDRVEPAVVESSLSQFRSNNEPSQKIFTSDRPNIVVLLLESFTADVVGAMHGEPGLTPTLDSLIHHGLLFDRIYSSGFRTDQGIVSVLNGWPATPYHSIMRSTEKSQRLPSAVRAVEKVGYRTSFYYGGAANFSNLGAYLQLEGFDRIMTQDSFPENPLKGKWGFHDEVVLKKQLDDLSLERQPFFSVVMTLSNHEPFDVPGETRVPGADEPSRFRNAVRYTDDALRVYFEIASRQSWYNNTLFVLIADHAHPLPKKRDILFPQGRHIPMVFAGRILCDSVQGSRIHTLGGHHDFPVTLLAQLGIDAADFSWSKNLLSKNTRSFAYLPFDDNLVWKSEAGWFLYDFKKDSIVERSFLYEDTEEEATLVRAKAYMQAHYGAYLDY